MPFGKLLGAGASFGTVGRKFAALNGGSGADDVAGRVAVGGGEIAARSAPGAAEVDGLE